MDASKSNPGAGERRETSRTLSCNTGYTVQEISKLAQSQLLLSSTTRPHIKSKGFYHGNDWEKYRRQCLVCDSCIVMTVYHTGICSGNQLLNACLDVMLKLEQVEWAPHPIDVRVARLKNRGILVIQGEPTASRGLKLYALEPEWRKKVGKIVTKVAQ